MINNSFELFENIQSSHVNFSIALILHSSIKNFKAPAKYAQNVGKIPNISQTSKVPKGFAGKKIHKNIIFIYGVYNMKEPSHVWPIFTLDGGTSRF